MPLNELPFSPAVLTAAFAVLGALVGSFLNVVILRLPDGDSLLGPRSRCPSCGYTIPGYHNVPVLSWFVLRGKCGSCRAPISFRYPVVEAIGSAVFVACFVRFGLTWTLLMALLLSASLVAITFIDLDHWIVPDEISIPGVVIGVLLRPVTFDVPWFSGLAGAVLGGGFLYGVRRLYMALRGQEGMGMGDVKLIAMTGAFLGPGSLLPTILCASVTGSVIGGAYLLYARYTAPAEPEAAPTEAVASESSPDEGDEDEEWTPPRGAVPFGPFLSLGALAYLFFSPAFAKLQWMVLG